MRRSKLTVLTWTDIEDQADAVAVHVCRPKTNQDGSGQDTRFVKNRSARAIRELGKLRAESGRAGDDAVFGLPPDAVGDRIKATIAHAGIDSQGVAAHSCHRAHATELATRGASIADICRSGGGQSPSMPVRYCAGIAAANNAVARYL